MPLAPIASVVAVAEMAGTRQTRACLAPTITSMKRRTLLQTPLIAAASAAVVSSVPGLARADEPRIDSLPAAQRWLDQLLAAREARATGAWPLPAVLEHLAQSIEMSMDGFPQPRSAAFQHTLGAAAFAVFSWRGRMSHGLAEPIPGAPALRIDATLPDAAARLREAIERFERHQGPLAPHFAYGALDKARFAQAHCLHIANHQDEIVLRA